MVIGKNHKVLKSTDLRSDNFETQYQVAKDQFEILCLIFESKGIKSIQFDNPVHFCDFNQLKTKVNKSMKIVEMIEQKFNVSLMERWHQLSSFKQETSLTMIKQIIQMNTLYEPLI